MIQNILPLPTCDRGREPTRNAQKPIDPNPCTIKKRPLMSPHLQPETADSGACVRTIAVKAGHRTYFFDVRTTSKGEMYLTVTERRRTFSADGTPGSDRHQLFLYKEDFDKFAGGLSEAIAFIGEQTRTPAERKEHAEV